MFQIIHIHTQYGTAKHDAWIHCAISVRKL
jgi:hypothetical protein